MAVLEIFPTRPSRGITFASIDAIIPCEQFRASTSQHSGGSAFKRA